MSAIFMCLAAGWKHWTHPIALNWHQEHSVAAILGLPLMALATKFGIPLPNMCLLPEVLIFLTSSVLHSLQCMPPPPPPLTSHIRILCCLSHLSACLLLHLQYLLQ